MPKMIPIVYLNENFMGCNENLAWGKWEPLIHPYMFWYKAKGEKVAEYHYTFFSCSNHTFFNQSNINSY